MRSAFGHRARPEGKCGDRLRAAHLKHIRHTQQSRRCRKSRPPARARRRRCSARRHLRRNHRHHQRRRQRIAARRDIGGHGVERPHDLPQPQSRTTPSLDSAGSCISANRRMFGGRDVDGVAKLRAQLAAASPTSCSRPGPTCRQTPSNLRAYSSSARSPRFRTASRMGRTTASASANRAARRASSCRSRQRVRSGSWDCYHGGRPTLPPREFES